MTEGLNPVMPGRAFAPQVAYETCRGGAWTSQSRDARESVRAHARSVDGRPRDRLNPVMPGRAFAPSVDRRPRRRLQLSQSRDARESVRA